MTSDRKTFTGGDAFPEYPWYALLLFLTVTVFLPVCRNGFIAGYDDELYLTMNGMVRQGLTLDGIRWAFTTFTGGNWHPLTWLSHMFDVTMFGLSPAGHHLVSLALHCGTVLLLFRLLRELGCLPTVAWWLAAFFSVHPQRVESVAWAAERKDVLALFFGIAALLSYASYVRRRSPGRYLQVVSLLLASLMSKPLLVTLPLLLIMMDLTVFERMKRVPLWRLLIEKIPLLALAAAIAMVTWSAQTDSGAIVASPLAARLTVAVAAYGEYVRLFFLPLGLSFHYPLAGTVIGVWRPLAGLLLLAGMILFCRRRDSLVRLGTCWFLLTLLPVSGIVRFGGQFVADRYAYLPHIGLLLVLCRIVSPVRPAHRLPVTAALCCLLTVCCWLTVRQIGYWHDGERLYRRAIELNGANWLAYGNLAAVLLQQDRYGEGFLLLARSQLLRGRPAEALETLGSARRAGGVPQRELDIFHDEIVRRMR